MITRTETETRRKRYAMHRLDLAMKRLIHAGTAAEQIMARRWVIAWGAAVGERRFSPIWHGSSAHAGAATARSQSAAGRAQ
ncbi:MAG TPA: hypothetical protein VJS30_10060 [Paraburkholderia sp.]|nr:hypothetical protein [Paraburkholderia sp.]